MGEVSLKVSRSHALSRPSPSVENSREEKPTASYGMFLVLHDTRSVHHDLVQSREGADEA